MISNLLVPYLVILVGADPIQVPLMPHRHSVRGQVKSHPSPIFLEMNATSAQAWTDAHNEKRAAHGVPDFTWSNAMAANAQVWAEELVSVVAAGGQWSHSPSYQLSPPLGPAGENLARRTSSASGVQQTPTQAVAGWYSEINVCTWPGCEQPNTQLCDQYPDVPCMTGHFTALIWKDATTLGCGQASGTVVSSGNSFVISVCQYKGGDSITCATPNVGSCYDDQVTQAGGGGSAGPPAPSPAPTPTPPPPLVQKCVGDGSVSLCGECKESSDCMGDAFCCPWMKKCVASSSTSCSYPIAKCNPTCHTGLCDSCEPTDGSDYTTQWTCDRCIAKDTWHGDCGSYTWACTDDRYPWFRDACSKTCNTCGSSLLQETHKAKMHAHTTKFADKIMMTVDSDGKTTMGK